MRHLTLFFALVFTACGSMQGRPASGPLIWVVERGDSRVYILGFGEARDRSWLSPTIERVLAESDEVWFETPQGNSQPPSAAVLQEIGYDTSKPLSTALDPALYERTKSMAASLGMDLARLDTMRPWMARTAIQRAYQASGKAAAVEADYADAVIAQKAVAAGKTLNFEYATFEAVLRMFAGMSDQAQSEYLTDMLDYIDDAAAGRHSRHEEWITGHPNTDSIDNQRHKTPALYDAMHVQRNAWWANRIDEMLGTGKTHFVVLGLNHVLGPDSVLKNIERRGMGYRSEY